MWETPIFLTNNPRKETYTRLRKIIVKILSSAFLKLSDKLVNDIFVIPNSCTIFVF